MYPDLPPERKRVLRKSWRLPHAIYALAKGWISTIKNREPKEFEPKNTEGKVVELPKATIKAPEQAIEIAGRNAQDGKTTMILTSCGYMLGNVRRNFEQMDYRIIIHTGCPVAIGIRWDRLQTTARKYPPGSGCLHF